MSFFGGHDAYNPGPDGMLKIELSDLNLFNDANTKIVTIGSCFAANVQRILNELGGSCYHSTPVCKHFSPQSIEQLLSFVKSGNDFSKSELYYYNDKLGGFAPYMFHYKERFFDEERCIEELNKEIVCMKDEIRKADLIILTFGIANSLHLKTDDRVVNRAGGIPKSDYEIKRYGVGQVVESMANILGMLSEMNNGRAKYVFTVSPQRYLFHRQFSVDCPEGAAMANLVESPHVENTISKAILRIAVEEVVEKSADNSIYYFPSYEIVIDELRSLEPFNHASRTHIHDPATSRYVTERFVKRFFSDDVVQQFGMIKRLDALYTAVRTYGKKSKLFLYDKYKQIKDEAQVITDGFSNCNPLLIRLLIAIAAVVEKDDVDYILNSLLSPGERLVFWGASGDFVDKYSDFAQRNKATYDIHLMDSDSNKAGIDVAGFRVESPDALVELGACSLIISSTYYKEILDVVNRLDIDVRKVV